MPGKSKSGGTRTRNDARRCGKGWKKNPGVSPNAHSGKTVGGYTAAKAEARAAKRKAA